MGKVSLILGRIATPAIAATVGAVVVVIAPDIHAAFCTGIGL